MFLAQSTGVSGLKEHGSCGIKRKDLLPMAGQPYVCSPREEDLFAKVKNVQAAGIGVTQL